MFAQDATPNARLVPEVLDERLALACQAGHLVLQVTDAFDE